MIGPPTQPDIRVANLVQLLSLVLQTAFCALHCTLSNCKVSPIRCVNMPTTVRTTLIKAGEKTKKCVQTAVWQTCKCVLWIICTPCICCAILLLPRGRSTRQNHGEPYEPPVPQMPAPRRRTLSIPSSTFQEEQYILEQPQSAFMNKLPLEIRRMIYAHALGNTEIHAATRDGALLVHGCFSPKTCRGANFAYEGVQKRVGFALPLLRTCRLIYSEAVEYLYASNTIALSNCSRQIPTIDYLSYFILPHRFVQIRKMHIYWNIDSSPYYFLIPRDMRLDSESSPWLTSWRAITKLKGLRQFHVILAAPSSPNFFLHNPHYWKMFGRPLLESIPRIEVKLFVITLPSNTCERRARMKNPQCKLRLPCHRRKIW